MWKLEPCALLIGMSTGASSMENSIEVPQKLKIELLYDPAISLLCIYSKEFKAGSWGYICTPIFIGAIFLIAMGWKQPKCWLTDG